MYKPESQILFYYCSNCDTLNYPNGPSTHSTVPVSAKARCSRCGREEVVNWLDSMFNTEESLAPAGKSGEELGTRE